MSTISIGTANGIRGAFERASYVCIVSHINPDGDAVGSCVALKHYLADVLGKRAEIVLQDDFPDALGFICDAEDIGHSIGNCDLVVCLDVGGLDRTGVLKAGIEASGAPKILVDHHKNPSGEEFDLVLSDTEVSSTCELLYDLLKMMPEIAGNPAALPEKCRLALMTGMTTDTNNFANSVFPGTLTMASELLSTGVDRDVIIENVLNSYRENRLRAMGFLLDNKLVVSTLGYAYMILDREVIERFGLQDGETEGFVNLPLAIKKVRLSAFLKEDNGFFRVSLRSKDGVSARELAVSTFHGGGHERASGGRLLCPGDISCAEEAGAFMEKALSGFMRFSARLVQDDGCEKQ